MNDPFPWQEYYPSGVRREFEPPSVSLWDLLEHQARNNPDAPFLHYDGQTLSYGMVHRRALIAASQFQARGFARAKRAERLLISMPNSPEFVQSYFGALRADMLPVCIPNDLNAGEYLQYLEDVEPKAAVVNSATAFEFEKALGVMRMKKPRRTYYVTPGRDYAPDGGQQFEFWELLLGRPRPSQTRNDVDPAILQYTSGTTGRHKIALMSHRNLVANALQNNRWFGWTQDDVILGALPFYHTWGLSCVLHAAVAAGASIALLPKFDADEVQRTITQHNVSVAYGSGTMFHRLLDAAGDNANEVFKGLRYVKAGAMLIQSSLTERWEAAVPDVPMINGYGLTEASPEVCNNPPKRTKPNTVGIPLPGTEIRIVDPEQPEIVLDNGEQGEIQCRGPQVTLGYWSDPRATRQAILPGGWLRTGDIGLFDDEGYLIIVDRIKDLIKFRGVSLIPSAIERVLCTHPLVNEAVVVGIPDDVDGEIPAAALVLDGDHSELPTEFTDWVAENLSGYDVPRQFNVIEEVPKNKVGKPLRRGVRELLVNLNDSR